MAQRIRGKCIKKKFKVFEGACRGALHLYNVIRLNYVVELKLGDDYLDEKGNKIAVILENYFVEEGYDIIVECYWKRIIHT